MATSLSLLRYNISLLTYDVVYRKWNRVRILVFIDGHVDEISIKASGKNITVYALNSETKEYAKLLIPINFRIKKYKYIMKNGVLVIDVFRKILPFL
ncbi:MAG: hypothetical protein ABWW65_06730 [Thermoprotei archaeon]